MELAGEVEKLTRRLHPHDEEAAERQAVDAFLGALEQPLAAEVQKLGCHTMESMVTAARRIEKILVEQADPGMSIECRNKSGSFSRVLRIPANKSPNQLPF